MQRPRFFLRRAALIMALLLFALPARALDLSRDELRALFSSLTDAESDALFAETPSIEPPYAAGMLNDEQIDSALGTLNVLRALAGLPEVTGDDELNDIAQHGAVLSAARGEITHAPEPVASMPDDFYALGAAAAARCNLALFNWHEPRLAARAMVFFMQDDTAGNLADLGHRRWMLSPAMGKAGLGLALDEPGRSYIALYVTDASASFDYDSIAWPCAGAFPAELMNAATPWSISLNPEKYDLAASKPRVTLTEEISGARWEMESGDSADTDGAYFTLSFGRFGDGPACIFRPDLSEYPALENGYEQNQVWHIVLSGLVGTDGAPCADIAFTCEMASLTPIDPAGIELNARGYALCVGEKRVVSATVYPRWADDLHYTLSVDDPAVASIAPDGTLIGLAEGKCTLTARTANGRSDEIFVTVGGGE